MEISELALIISALMLGCSVLTFAFARSKDHGKREYWEGQTTNKLEGISDDLKDMKAQQRVTDQRITEVYNIASKARDSANAAHDRLDRAGII